ncbi:swi5-dependent recombination DNA repair protein 1 homolog isoform X2 [Lasioglossum baleicum]|uniref:swi5-dependent recombination DNA repair protein 1 homolog isoform X2 n=1 Tax=Lasioglossum baleicum TaxID=434251 RepID=UPI003FCC2CC9
MSKTLLIIIINMSSKPFRNSKSVNKPFRSPFSTPRSKSTKNIANTPESNSSESRVSASKKSLFQTPPTKRLRLTEEVTKDQRNTEQSKELCRNDLELLKKRIQEKQESISNIKTTLLYKKKNNAEDIRNSIKKWTEVCQIVLGDYQDDLKKRNEQSVSIMDILSSFGIDPKLVQFSPDDDTFYVKEPPLNI